MKTKLTAPWNVRPGDTLRLYLMPDSNATHDVKVRSVTKTRGTFTGATVWRFHYVCPISNHANWTTCHGKRRSHIKGIADWPADKIEKVIP